MSKYRRDIDLELDGVKCTREFYTVTNNDPIILNHSRPSCKAVVVRIGDRDIDHILKGHNVCEDNEYWELTLLEEITEETKVTVFYPWFYKLEDEERWVKDRAEIEKVKRMTDAEVKAYWGKGKKETILQRLAEWSKDNRFLAWVVDMVTVGVVASLLINVFGFPPSQAITVLMALLVVWSALINRKQ